MCFKLSTVRYDSDDNLVVHSSDIHFKVSEAGVTEVRKTRRLTTRGMESSRRGAHAGSCKRRAPGRVARQLLKTAKRELSG